MGPEIYGLGLHKRVAGIFEMGFVGKAVAERLKDFGMELIFIPVNSLCHRKKKRN